MQSSSCKECGKRFYSAEPRDNCQRCEGDHDPSKQQEADKQAVASRQVKPEDQQPQSVDPRTGEAAKPKKRRTTKPKAQQTTKPKGEGQATTK